MTRASAMLTAAGRLCLFERCERRPIAHVAARAVVPCQTVTKWLCRSESLGEVGVVDHSNALHTGPTRTRPESVARFEALRRTDKFTARQIHVELNRKAHSIAPVTVERRLGIVRRRGIDSTRDTNLMIGRIVARCPEHMVHLGLKELGLIPTVVAGVPTAAGPRPPRPSTAPTPRAPELSTSTGIRPSTGSPASPTPRPPRREVEQHDRVQEPGPEVLRRARTTRISCVVTGSGSNRRVRDFYGAMFASAARHQGICPCTSKRSGKVQRYNCDFSDELFCACIRTSDAHRAEAIIVWTIHHNYHRAHCSRGSTPSLMAPNACHQSQDSELIEFREPTDREVA